MKIVVINGPNINFLGIREPDVYGNKTYEDLQELIKRHGNMRGVEIDFFQSNSEGELVSAIQRTLGGYDGIIINPAAYTHYSYAIHDALKSVSTPAIEVHISNIHSRDEFRSKSVIAAAAVGQICGLGFAGYLLAVDYFVGVKC